MEREACVCDHGYERSDLRAEIIIIIITTSTYYSSCCLSHRLELLTVTRSTNDIRAAEGGD